MCTPRNLTASDWEHRLEGLPLPDPGEVDAPAYLATRLPARQITPASPIRSPIRC